MVDFEEGGTADLFGAERGGVRRHEGIEGRVPGREGGGVDHEEIVNN